MTDPLSIATAVFALATAASQISTAISRLRHFGEVPGKVYSLKNEVSDLEVVLRQIANAIEQKSLGQDDKQAALEGILERTKASLADLARALERVANACEGSKIKIISKSTIWWKEKELFQGFREEIASIKTTLNMMLGASNSLDLNTIILELRRVTVLSAIKGELAQSSHRSSNEHHTTLGARMDQQYQDLNERLDTLGKLISNGQFQDGRSFAQALIPSEKAVANTEHLRILTSYRIPCRSWCPCVCHTKQKLKLAAPGIMQTMLGRLFVGYSGLPILKKPCDFRGCRDQQKATATVEYWFPSWFVSMNLKVHCTYLAQTGPQLQLSTTRRVPDDSQSISFAMQGDIDGLKYLFSHGLASPRDVSDSRGYTLMRWALYGGMHNHEAVQFLLHQGAKVDETSFENVWDFIFRGKCNEKQQQALRCITENGENDWVEEQNFPLIHRIIFGLSSKSLAVELEENPHAVHIMDSQNRTALDWATARVQLEDMSLLLSHGADPNNMDATGRTPVLHAVDSHNVSGLRLILAGGADPNPKMPKGVFRSSPLTAAGFAGMPEMLKALLDYEADPNACNPEGLTALHSVARTQNVECALLLLEYGADLNKMSYNSKTPLSIAVIHNNHPVLQLFVDRAHEYVSTMRLKGPEMLSVIAEHADIETINILAFSNSMKISYGLQVDNLVGSREILAKRRDCDEKLAEAFEELIAVAKAEEAQSRSSAGSLMEAGLFLSARSSFHDELSAAMANLGSTICSPVDSSASFDSFEDSHEYLISLEPKEFLHE